MYCIKRLIQEIGKGAVDANEIACEVENCEKIRLQIRNLAKIKSKEEERHEEELKHIRSKLIKIQNVCPHHITTYYPDASGGRDSSTICDICEKEVR